MNETKIRSQLEIATNIIVVLVSIAILSVLTSRILERNSEAHLESGLQRGQKLDAFRSSKSETLVIVSNTNCQACRESVSFYNQLVEQQHKANSRVAIVAVFANTPEAVKDYVQQVHLNVPTSVTMELRSLGTPAIIMIDAKGNIGDFWLGKLTKDEENQVIKAVMRTA